MGFMGLMVLGGIVSTLYGLYGIRSSSSDAGAAVAAGAGMLILSVAFLRWASTEHGLITVTASELSWERSGKSVGTWAVADITQLKRTRSLLSFHGPLHSDYNLHAHTTAGERVRIANGIHEDVVAVESWLRETWQDNAPDAAPSP